MTTQVAVADSFVTLNDLRFHYREWGSPELPPLVLLHGGASFARAWDPVAAALADRFHVLALDQRGHGESAWAEDYAPDLWIDDVERFAKALALPSMALLELSLGCTVAFCYAARYPSRLDRLVLVDNAPFEAESSPPGDLQAQLLAEAQESFDNLEAGIQSRLRNSAWAALAASRPAAAAGLRARTTYNLVQGANGRWRWRYDAAGLAQIVSAWCEPGTAVEQWALVAQMRCPTLVVRGATSPVLSREHAERLAHTIPNCRWVEVPDSGHAVPFDNEAGFLQVVRPFLLADAAVEAAR